MWSTNNLAQFVLLLLFVFTVNNISIIHNSNFWLSLLKNMLNDWLNNDLLLNWSKNVTAYLVAFVYHSTLGIWSELYLQKSVWMVSIDSLIIIWLVLWYNILWTYFVLVKEFQQINFAFVECLYPLPSRLSFCKLCSCWVNELSRFHCHVVTS